MKVFSTSNRILITIAVYLCALTGSALVYHNTTTKLNYFDYSGYTFTYEEDGVTKTASILDKATTPEHQMALLRYIYKNPDIPGIHYAYDYNGTQHRKIDYNYWAHQGQNDAVYWVGTTSEVYTNPTYDGMTMLLVAVKDTWKVSYHKITNAWEYFNSAIDYIQLMPDFVRVNDPYNPGYLFFLEEESLSRFFFISKGKPRSSYTKPFYRLYEQISPVNDFDDNDMESFYDHLIAGENCLCYHDCTNVFSMTTKQSDGSTIPHWFSISKKDEGYQLNNLAIFMPDRRLEYDLTGDNVPDKNNDSSLFNEYGNSENPTEMVDSVMPHVVLITADLHAKAQRADSLGYYKIKLEWESAITTMHVPQYYYVYQYDPVTHTQTLLSTIPLFPTTDTTHEILVEQQDDPQDFYYVITAMPIMYDNEGNIRYGTNGEPLTRLTATSPIRKVTVPGKDPFYSQDAEYRSRYDIDNQINIYKNTMCLKPEGSDDYTHIKNNTNPFILTRTDVNGNKVNVASVTFSQNPVEGYDYVVAYNAESQDLVNLFDEEIPVLAGHFNDPDSAEVMLIDRFSASTESNAQPAGYTYRFEQDGFEFSNEIFVRVFKTTNTVAFVGVTQEDVDNDDDRTVERGPYNSISFDAINEPLADLMGYEIWAKNSLGTQKVGKADNTRNDGVYHLFGMTSDKTLNDYYGTDTIGFEGGTLKIIDRNTDRSSITTYVPVITAYYDRKRMLKNTYGCDKKELTYPAVDLTFSKNDMLKSNPFNNGWGMRMGYKTKMTIKPVWKRGNVNLQNKYDVYRYRVWRVNGTTNTELSEETLLNNLSNVSGTSTASDGTVVSWASDYSAIQTFNPGNGNQTYTDLFIDLPISGSSKKVKYIVRMYARNHDYMPAPNPVRRKAITEQDDGYYYITQVTKEVTFDSTVPTGIIDVAPADAEVVSETYYNTLGMESATPQKGVNIVVTRYSDGTQVSRKVIK